MAKDNDVQINDQVQSLINAVNNYFPGKVTVDFIGKMKAGFVRQDQSQIVQDKDHIYIQVSDLSAPNYTASHELLHLLMILRGFPQVFFSLTTGQDQLDDQLKMMGTELYDIVSHIVVVAEQRKHNLINKRIEALYFNGIYNTIKPEPNPLDDQMTLRLLTLIDAHVFYGDNYDSVSDQLKKDFPVSFAAAEKIYNIITEKPTNSPFELRRNVVKIFKAFDNQLKQWELPPLHNSEFTTVTTVLSKRQLNLEVRQLFQIFHSELFEKNTDTRAYVGFYKADEQNSFVISGPKGNKEDPEFFKSMYDKKVEDLFKELKMPYIIRQ